MDRMKHKSHYILQLYVQKVAGTISEDDLVYLENVLKEDEELRALCSDWDLDLNSDESKRQLDPEVNNLRWQQIKKKYEEHVPEQRSAADIRTGRIVLLKRFVGAVAAVAVLAMGISMFRTPEERPTSNPLLATKSTHLNMPGGRVINLDETLSDQHFNVGTVNLDNEKDELRFSAGGNAGAGYASLEVPAGKQHTIELPDGTVATLNSASSLRFPVAFGKGNREVELTGEAYFDVAKNASSPFVVKSHGTKVEVLGTVFNVNSYNPKDIRTSLRDGSVRVHGGNTSTLLKPGDEASSLEGAGITISSFNDLNVFSWKNGVMNFEDASLESISATLSRWYDVDVVFNRPGLKGTRYNLTIEKSKPIENALNRLVKLSSGGLNYTLKDGVVRFE
ncbi:FecR family protein [uncultured Chitinophaga sp.]|uniref:FecR family protein n=1 Tax=uncultured Chitinophaga sp. TaxID=339340 RepID=UPI0025F3E733|nr:FecR family protein [uncultured Chitinophaga sp.]